MHKLNPLVLFGVMTTGEFYMLKLSSIIPSRVSSMHPSFKNSLSFPFIGEFSFVCYFLSLSRGDLMFDFKTVRNVTSQVTYFFNVFVDDLLRFSAIDVYFVSGFSFVTFSARQNLKTPKKKFFSVQNQIRYNSKIIIRV